MQKKQHRSKGLNKVIYASLLFRESVRDQIKAHFVKELSQIWMSTIKTQHN